MGLFDTIITKIKPPIRCPNCRMLLSNEFQTKDLDNWFIDPYIEGDSSQKRYNIRIKTDNEKAIERLEQIRDYGKELLICPTIRDEHSYYLEPHPIDVIVKAYNSCDGCNTFVYQRFKFDSKGLLKRYKKLFIEGLTR